MKDTFPEAARELDEHLHTLEQHYSDMCDIEFTIERGKLWMLQTRVGKRAAAAALRMAVDMVDEGLIDVERGDRTGPPRTARGAAAPALRARDPRPADDRAGRLPGAAVGVITFTADEAVVGRPPVRTSSSSGPRPRPTTSRAWSPRRGC
jgi:pyruvate, orthophosphate dikinase